MAGEETTTPSRGPGGQRPCLLTPEVHDQLVEAFSIGATIDIATRAVGISPVTYHRWRNKGKAHVEEGADTKFARFYVAVTKARGRGDLELLESVRKRVRGKECVLCDGKGAVQASMLGVKDEEYAEELRVCPACKGSTMSFYPDGKLALDVLSRRHTDFAAQGRQKVEHSGPNGGPVQVQAVTLALSVEQINAFRQLGADQLAALAFDGEADEVDATPERVLIPARRED